MLISKKELKVHSAQVLSQAEFYKETDEHALFTLRNMLVLFRHFDPDQLDEFEDKLNSI